MNIETHTVTLPVKDYLELKEAEQFLKLRKLDKDEPLEKVIKEYVSTFPNATKDLLDKMEIFIKIQP